MTMVHVCERGGKNGTVETKKKYVGRGEGKGGSDEADRQGSGVTEARSERRPYPRK